MDMYRRSSLLINDLFPNMKPQMMGSYKDIKEKFNVLD